MMGVSALTLGSLMAGSTMLSGLMTSASQKNQQQAQARAMEAEARNLRAQAESQLAQGEIAAQQNDKQRQRLRREYEVKEGRNNNLLAVGNVDLSSGSAMAVQEGNADAYAGDLAENSYQRALTLWENNNRVNATLNQARTLEANAASQKRQAANLVPSLLSTSLAAGSSFLTGYTMAGGRIGLKKP